MGIFNKDKKEEAKKDVSVVKSEKNSDDKKSVASKSAVSDFDSGSVIKNPRITEKAAYASDNNVYTFDVATRTTKIEVAKAVKDIYNVEPVKVNIVAIPKKKVYRRDGVGVKRGGKKAYVFLKKGDKIEFV